MMSKTTYNLEPKEIRSPFSTIGSIEYYSISIVEVYSINDMPNGNNIRKIFSLITCFDKRGSVSYQEFAKTNRKRKLYFQPKRLTIPHIVGRCQQSRK